MDPMEAMKIFEQATGTKPMAMAGTSTDNDLTTTMMLIDSDKDIFMIK